MTEQTHFIINITLISLVEIYLMIRYLMKKVPGKLFENIFLYAIVLTFLIYEYLKLSIPNFIIVCSLLTVIGHTFLGSYLKWYYTSKIYDRYLHLLGAFSFSLLAFSIIHAINPLTNYSVLYSSLFVMTLGITIGVFFEIIEFTHDSFSNKIPCQHGLKDTDFDLIFNIIGSIIAGLITKGVFF